MATSDQDGSRAPEGPRPSEPLTRKALLEKSLSKGGFGDAGSRRSAWYVIKTLFMAVALPV